MKTVFIVVDEITETIGHGQFSKAMKLSTYGKFNDQIFPAFKSREDAQKFIESVFEYWKPEILELTIN